jgi:hypothetical protein
MSFFWRQADKTDDNALFLAMKQKGLSVLAEQAFEVSFRGQNPVYPNILLFFLIGVDFTYAKSIYIQTHLCSHFQFLNSFVYILRSILR